MVRYVNFDADVVAYKAYELWVEDVKDGNYDEDEFSEWLGEVKQVDEDEINLNFEGCRDIYENEYIEYLIKTTNEIPDKYYEKAGEYYSEEAADNGYCARFI